MATVAADPVVVRQTLIDLLVASCDEIKSGFPYEPEQLGELPCIALVLRSMDPAEQATGPRLDVSWRWELGIYAGLSDWVASQQQIDTICQQLLSVWRDDPTLGHMIEWWRIRDYGRPIEFGTRQQTMLKVLIIECQMENVQ